ncbi:MAG TPA: riboflavin synthase [Polyangiaceae bacterium]|jgi:riboflavin synthase|nr:riboflavin synthase [Polyangiaceae bacterium]
MFTGLVAARGVLAAREPRGPGARLSLSAAFDDGPFTLGESIAVDGVCLSVDAITKTGFEADASAETLARTTLGALAPGAILHLERSLRAGSLMGGHLVTGHVDGVGTLVSRTPVGEAVAMVFRMPPDLARFVAEKGSIAVDGVSLTVNAVRDAVDGKDATNATSARSGPNAPQTEHAFSVMLIPHTLAKTKLGALGPGDPVNLEVDLVARYVARLMPAER